MTHEEDFNLRHGYDSWWDWDMNDLISFLKEKLDNPANHSKYADKPGILGLIMQANDKLNELIQAHNEAELKISALEERVKKLENKLTPKIDWPDMTYKP